MIRSLRGIAVFALVALMVACSPYPGEGVVDTRDLRERGDIEEITGKVFGVKEGSDEAVLTMSEDSRVLYNLEDQVWAHVTEGAPLPELNLGYDAVPSDGLDEALALMVTEAEAKVEEVRQEIAEKVAKLEAQKQEQIDRRDEAKAGAAGYEAAVAEAKGAFEKAEKALKSAINRYNAAIEAPVTQLNALAKTHGLKEVPSYRNPLKSYRYSSFKDGEKPASCKRARNKFVLNMLDSHNQCMYFSLPSGYAKHDAEVTKILKSGITELESATASLGERGGWNSKGTGAYAAMATAKDTYQNAVAKARDEFGDNRRRERIIRDTEQWIARFQKDIDEMSSDAEFKKQIGWTIFNPSDAITDKFKAYRTAMDEHFLANYVNTLGDITKESDTANGRFDLESGYVRIVTVTDALVDFGGRKRVLRHEGYADLTSKNVQEADVVSIEMDYRKMDSRPRDESLEQMQEDVIDLVLRNARRGESEKA